jgi:acyl-ACP thioesterase
MTESIFYQKAYTVELRDVDFLNELKLSILFHFFQETASLAASQLGAGIEKLAQQNGIAWILMRVKVEISRMPKLGERFTIETWPQPPGRIEIERDFIVRDSGNRVLIRAVSSWVLMDLHERKIKRTSAVDLTYSSEGTERALVHRFKKLKSSSGLTPVYEKTVGYSDIDFNGHLNNSQYINVMMDCFPIEEYQQYRICTLEINYIEEAFSQDAIVLKKDGRLSEGTNILIEGTKKENEKPVFRAKLTAEKRK